jgi:hypothetical protein
MGWLLSRQLRLPAVGVCWAVSMVLGADWEALDGGGGELDVHVSSADMLLRRARAMFNR